MSKINISYEKTYTDDSGRKIPDLFSAYEPSVLLIKTLWNGIVDGFFTHNNTSVIITAITGNIRIVVVGDDRTDKIRFEQYFLSGMDGKEIEIPADVKYAIQNMDEGKSTYAIGSQDIPNMEYGNKSIFNWRKKTP